MLKLKTGNLLDSRANVIGHGVNCRGVFNAGIALQIRRKYPQVYDAYVNKYTSSKWMCGEIQVVKLNFAPDKYIVNMATQYDFGRNGVYASLDYIEECLVKLLVFCSEKNLTMAIPYIGSGLGGLPAEKVENLVYKLCEPSSVRCELWRLS